MIEFLQAHQLDIMLFICGTCGILAFLLFLTRFLPTSRKRILILMELIALFLLWFDRLAYIYAGVPGRTEFIMVRVSNFMVFFLTSAIVFGFDLYLIDWLRNEGKIDPLPLRLKLVGLLSVLGMLLAVISAFSGLYYYFDEANRYHRGQGFLIAYIIPVLGPLIQYSVVRQYRKVFSRLIYISLLLYIFLPIACGIIQVFAYGVSLVNMAMVLVSISLYVFTYLDINNTVEHAHGIEIRNMKSENKRIQRQFDRTIMAFVTELEKKEGRPKGSFVFTAECAKRVAAYSGKKDEYCDKAYYTAIFAAAGLPAVPGMILDLTGTEAGEMEQIAKIAVDYADMAACGNGQDALPAYVMREEFVKGAGEKYDPMFADIMVRLIDLDSTIGVQDVPETELVCDAYREHISRGIEIDVRVKKISFECTTKAAGADTFSAPSIVLFDSFDRRVHSDEKTIAEFHYLEYGEVWFDSHMVTSAARKMEATVLSGKTPGESGNARVGRALYEITAFRFEDHIKLVMKAPDFVKEIVIALPDSTSSSYIGLTGEHCEIRNITVKTMDQEAHAGDIPRIVGEISYINHMEADIKNVQIDRTRSAATEGIPLDDRLRIDFHSMSLPMASLIWHCPYVVLYYSADGAVGGEDYREYALIKLNGESSGADESAQTRFKLKKKDDFPGWDAWKSINKKGFEYEVSFEKRGDRIILRADNLGIGIESITTVAACPDTVYVALTGDQVALTDIRIR